MGAIILLNTNLPSIVSLLGSLELIVNMQSIFY